MHAKVYAVSKKRQDHNEFDFSYEWQVLFMVRLSDFYPSLKEVNYPSIVFSAFGQHCDDIDWHRAINF